MKILGKVAALLPLTMMLAGGMPRSKDANGPSLTAPSPSVIESHLNKAEAELGIIMDITDSFEGRKAAGSESALLRYSMHLSRVHVEVGRMNLKDNRAHFLARVVRRLESHISDLTSLLAKTPVELHPGLTQALGHIEGAITLVRGATEDKRGRFELKISGYADPPALPWRPNR